MASLSELLPPEAISLDVPAADWRAAVSRCGDALVASGATEPGYTQQMIDLVDELGAYIVIAPGIALAHARPSGSVRRVGFSWVRLVEPVRFGHPDNDPVRLVVGLAAPDSGAHIEALATLAGLLMDGDRRAALLAVRGTGTLRAAIASYERQVGE